MVRALAGDGGKKFQKVTLPLYRYTKGSLLNYRGVERRPPEVELADLEQQIRRLRSRVQSLTALFVVFLLGWYGWVKFTDLMTTRPTIHVDGQNIRFSVLNDGPYVITCVTASAGGGGDKRWAPLDPPCGVIDSHGADIDISKLRWYDILGEKTDPPSKEAKFSVLYYQPEQVKPRETAEAS